MINAREEFENAVREYGDEETTLGEPETLIVEPLVEYEVLCAWVCFGEGSFDPNMDNAIYLRKGHTSQEYEEFLAKIDREYDDGYGGQELYGVIWLTNGDWFQRHEYDGSEYWDHMTRPEILEGCEGPPVVKDATKK